MNKIGASSLCTFLLYQSMNTGYKLGYTFDFLVAGSGRTCLVRAFQKKYFLKNPAPRNFCSISRSIIGSFIFFISIGCTFLYIFHNKNFPVDCQQVKQVNNTYKCGYRISVQDGSVTMANIVTTVLLLFNVFQWKK